jgi:hypothetical protein
VFPVLVQAQVLQEGTWSGTRVRVGRAGNPQTQRVSIEVKKAPDPHAGWRSEKRELWNVTLVAPNGRAPLSDVRLEGDSLSFAYRQEIEFTCQLKRQADGAFEGQCASPDDGRRLRMTLNPPKGS